jgi:iron complex outermembrane receptor protein
VTFPPIGTQSLLDPAYSFVVTRNPSNALIQSYLDRGFTITGVRPASIPWFYNGQAINVGSVKTDGLDFDLSYAHETGIGRLNFQVNGTLLFKYNVAINPQLGLLPQLGNINYPVKFRTQGRAGWSSDGASLEVTVNYVDSYKNNLVTPVQKVSAFTTFDAHLGYELQASSGLLRGLEFTVDAVNVFDRRPPFVNIQNGFDVGQASALGRFVSFGISKKF